MTHQTPETITQIPLDQLHESPFNHRRTFAGIEELAANSELPDADPLDLICHLAWNAPLLTLKRMAGTSDRKRSSWSITCAILQKRRKPCADVPYWMCAWSPCRVFRCMTSCACGACPCRCCF